MSTKDLRTRKNVPAGQAPSDVQQNIRMTWAQKRHLDVMAGILGISQAEFIRRVLEEQYKAMHQAAKPTTPTNTERETAQVDS